MPPLMRITVGILAVSFALESVGFAQELTPEVPVSRPPTTLDRFANQSRTLSVTIPADPSRPIKDLYLRQIFEEGRREQERIRDEAHYWNNLARSGAVLGLVGGVSDGASVFFPEPLKRGYDLARSAVEVTRSAAEFNSHPNSRTAGTAFLEGVGAMSVGLEAGGDAVAGGATGAAGKIVGAFAAERASEGIAKGSAGLLKLQELKTRNSIYGRVADGVEAAEKIYSSWNDFMAAENERLSIDQRYDSSVRMIDRIEQASKARTRSAGTMPCSDGSLSETGKCEDGNAKARGGAPPSVRAANDRCGKDDSGELAVAQELQALLSRGEEWTDEEGQIAQEKTAELLSKAADSLADCNPQVSILTREAAAAVSRGDWDQFAAAATQVLEAGGKEQRESSPSASQQRDGRGELKPDSYQPRAPRRPPLPR